MPGAALKEDTVHRLQNNLLYYRVIRLIHLRKLKRCKITLLYNYHVTR